MRKQRPPEDIVADLVKLSASLKTTNRDVNIFDEAAGVIGFLGRQSQQLNVVIAQLKNEAEDREKFITNMFERTKEAQKAYLGLLLVADDVKHAVDDLVVR